MDDRQRPRIRAVPHFVPEWPAPMVVRALQTTRGLARGQSSAGAAGFNLSPGPDFARREAALLELTGAPGPLVWPHQTHSALAACVDGPGACRADALVTGRPGLVLAIRTADCLPVFMAARDGSEVALAHAGWRGLAAGILGNTLAAMLARPREILVYLGPAIGSAHYEVGPEVRDAFMASPVEIDVEGSFARRHPATGGRGKYLANLESLARAQLRALGVRNIHGGGRCTYEEARPFFSHRRDPHSGRMASLIWLEVR